MQLSVFQNLECSISVHGCFYCMCCVGLLTFHKPTLLCITEFVVIGMVAEVTFPNLFAGNDVTAASLSGNLCGGNPDSTAITISSASTTINSPPSDSSRTSSTSTAGTVAAADANWVTNFMIPWSKCSPSLLSSLESGQAPSAKDLRELVSHTMSDVCFYTRRASRDTLRSIARKIVHRQPAAFADYINGKRVDDGVTSIMLMLESKKENLNRRLTAGTTNVVTEPSVNPPLPEPDLKKLEDTRLELCQLYSDNSECSRVDHCMLATYALQRHHINHGMPTTDVLSKWPYLNTGRIILEHCRILTNVDVGKLLRAQMCTRLDLVFQFLSAKGSGSNAEQVLQEMGSVDTLRRPYYFIPLLMKYFREDLHCLTCFFPVCTLQRWV